MFLKTRLSAPLLLHIHYVRYLPSKIFCIVIIVAVKMGPQPMGIPNHSERLIEKAMRPLARRFLRRHLWGRENFSNQSFSVNNNSWKI